MPQYDCNVCKENKYHLTRNCSKYFPDQPKVKYHWEPSYECKDGVFFIEGVGCDECPVSYVDSQSLELIQIVGRTDLACQDSSASLYGSNLSKWPSKVVDALVVLRGSKNQEHNARYEAERD